MVNSILASVAIFGASVSALGSAHVVNKCDYDVFTSVVPAQGGGQEQKELTLSPGESWDQDWTSLTNGAGWSIKFSETEGSFGTNILQYEYTYQSDGTIWYDLSCVDGSPWSGNWKISSDTDNCVPRQAAYRFSTDDAHGMQNGCPAAASITVTLCSNNDNTTGGDSQSSAAPSSSSSVAAVTPASSAPAYTAPAYTAPAYTAPAYSAPVVIPTTLATVVQKAAENNYVATVVETVIAYATAGVMQGNDGVIHVLPKRHQHHPHGHSE